MITKPAVVAKDDEDITTLGRIFGVPVVVKGWTWLPLLELPIWALMTWVAGKRRPTRSWAARLGIGLLTTPIVAGMEWCHNFAHAAAAWLVGKPMDRMRITWGTPLVVYFELDAPDVTPRQHIARALGGPIFNLLALTASALLRRRTHPDSVARDAANAAVGMNLLLMTVGMLPMPGIDGGPVLKWSLVEMGRTPEEADRVVARVDVALGAGMAAAGAVKLKQRRWWQAALLLSMGLAMLSMGLGIVKEE